jgi:hypothetical protein
VDAFDALHVVHELLHEEQSASVLAIDVAGRGGIDQRRVEIESRTLVRDLDDQPKTIDLGANVDVLRGVVEVAAEDRVGQRLGERDGDVEHDLALCVVQLFALAADEFNDTLDETDVAGDVDFYDSDFVAGAFFVGNGWHA